MERKYSLECDTKKEQEMTNKSNKMRSASNKLKENNDLHMVYGDLIEIRKSLAAAGWNYDYYPISVCNAYINHIGILKDIKLASPVSKIAEETDKFLLKEVSLFMKDMQKLIAGYEKSKMLGDNEKQR